MTTSDDGEEEGTAWTMECLCGENNCRRLLTAFASLPRELQMNMLLNSSAVTGIVPAFIVHESAELVQELKRQALDLYEGFRGALESQFRLAKRFKAAVSGGEE